jgi:hypothetical protein
MLDRELRGEAIEILRRLDALGEPAVDAAHPPQPPAEPRAEPPVTRPAGE